MQRGIFVIVCGICRGVDKKQISKWHNWPKNPHKYCTKIKPALIVFVVLCLRLLHQAALWDNAELLEDLLHGEELGCLDARDSWGRTALHAAATNLDSQCLRILCQVYSGFSFQHLTSFNSLPNSGNSQTTTGRPCIRRAHAWKRNLSETSSPNTTTL